MGSEMCIRDSPGDFSFSVDACHAMYQSAFQRRGNALRRFRHWVKPKRLAVAEKPYRVGSFRKNGSLTRGTWFAVKRMSETSGLTARRSQLLRSSGFDGSPKSELPRRT